MSRLEELLEKVQKPPYQLSVQEAMELQKLARESRATVGQSVARAERKAKRKGAPSLSLEELEQKLKEMQALTKGEQTNDSNVTSNK